MLNSGRLSLLIGRVLLVEDSQPSTWNKETHHTPPVLHLVEECGGFPHGESGIWREMNVETNNHVMFENIQLKNCGIYLYYRPATS